jgi:tetratricopeptide (TPR) repeat protein
MRSIRLGLGLVGENSDPHRSAIRSRLLTARSGCLKFQGKHTEALASANQALASAKHSADPEALGDANMAVHNELLYLGMRDITFGKRALALYEEAGLREAQAHALNNLAFFEWQEGNISGALTLYLQASEAAQSSGDGYVEAATQVNIAECLLELNLAHEAEATVKRILPSLRALEMHSFICAAYRHLARAQAHEHRLSEASDSLQIALDLAEQTEDLEEQVEALGALAAIQLTTFDLARCIENSRTAEVLAEANELRHALPRVLRVQGEALMATGAQRKAEESLRKALLFAEQFDAVEEGRIRLILDLAESVNTP